MRLNPFVDWIDVVQDRPSRIVRAEMTGDEFERLYYLPAMAAMEFVGPRPAVQVDVPAVRLVNGGHVLKVAATPDGVIGDTPEWITESRLSCRGSFESHMRLRSDGRTVHLDGNIGRWNRPDNLFGFDLHDTYQLLADFLERYDLPPFDVGQRIEKNDYGDNYEFGFRTAPELTDYDIKHGLTYFYTGAKINKVHLTQNMVTGSMQNAEAAMTWLQTQSRKRVKRSSYAAHGVIWGNKGRREYFKCYIKADEMLQHAKAHGLTKDQVLQDPVYQYCRKNGVIRFEAEYGDSFLKENHCYYMGEATMTKLVDKFTATFDDIFGRVRADITTIDPSNFDVPAGCVMAAMAYLRGEDVKAAMFAAGKERTFRNYAKSLKKYGLDINERLPSDHKLTSIIRVVDIKPLNQAPDWYWAHQTRMAAVAANAANEEKAAA